MRAGSVGERIERLEGIVMLLVKKQAGIPVSNALEERPSRIELPKGADIDELKKGLMSYQRYAELAAEALHAFAFDAPEPVARERPHLPRPIRESSQVQKPPPPQTFLSSNSLDEIESSEFSQIPPPSGFILQDMAPGPSLIGLAENPYPRINAITRLAEPL
jgi:hypothetical protein